MKKETIGQMNSRRMARQKEIFNTKAPTVKTHFAAQKEEEGGCKILSGGGFACNIKHKQEGQKALVEWKGNLKQGVK